MNNQFEQRAKGRKKNALMISLVVHLGLLSGVVGFAISDTSDWKSYLPEVVKEWFEAPEQPEETAKTKKPERA